MESYEYILECLWENSKKPRQESVTYFFKHTELFLDYIFMSLPGVEDGREFTCYLFIYLSRKIRFCLVHLAGYM